MSQSQSAFSYWRDKDRVSSDTSQESIRVVPHKPTAGPRSPSLKADSQTSSHTRSRPAIATRPPKLQHPVMSSRPHGSAADVGGKQLRVRSQQMSQATANKVPLLPPGSSWRPKRVLLDGPIGSNTGSKIINRTNLHGIKYSHDTECKTTENPPEPKQVSKIIERFNLDTSHTPKSHSAPASSKGKQFILPPRKPWEANVCINVGEIQGEGVELKRASESVGRGEATVRKELKRRRVGGNSLKVKTETIMEESESGEMGESVEVEKDRVRETRSLSGSKRTSGSLQIKSSWTSYIDGPEEPKVNSIQASLSPPPPQPSHSPHISPVRISHPPLSPTFSTTSLVQSFSESFRTSTSKTAHNYLRKVCPYSDETQQFWNMVESIRKEGVSCQGYLNSPLLSTSHPLPDSPPLYRTTLVNKRGAAASKTAGGAGGHVITVSMITHCSDQPLIFQCSAQSTVHDVIQRSVAQGGQVQRSSGNQWLKVCGRDDYLDPVRKLVDYVYVHNCLKLHTELKVQVVTREKLLKSLSFKPLSCPLPPSSSSSTHHCDQSSVQLISAHELNNLLDSYITKEAKFKAVIESHMETPSPIPIPTLVQTVISCVKLLCERLLYVEPPSLSEAIYNLRRACKSVGHHDNHGSVIGDSEDKSSVDENGDISSQQEEGIKSPPRSPVYRGYMTTDDVITDDIIADDVTDRSTHEIVSALTLVRESVHYLVSLYCISLNPGYLPQWWVEPQETVRVSTLSRSLRVKVCALHQIPLTEYRRYSQFQLEVCVYHGGLPLSKRAYSPPAKITRSFFNSVVWNKWLNFNVLVAHLPRESRLCLTLLGLENSGNTERPWNRSPIAWVTQRLFNSEGVLIFGPRLLGLWGTDDAVDPLDSPYPNTSTNKCALLELIFDGSGERVICDEPPTHSLAKTSPARPGPAPSMYRGLKKMSTRDRFSSLSMEDEKLIWSSRFLLQTHLGSSPRGLPLLLLSTPHWHAPHCNDVWAVLQSWPCSDPVHGLELLDAQLADGEVRKTAVYWLSGLPDDDLCDFLPQLVQSLRHDCYEASAMAQILLTRAMSSPRIAHHLYWHLRVLATGQGERYAIRFQHMHQALEILMGERIKNDFNTQVELVEQLVAVAGVVKATRDAHRQTVLVQELQRIGERFMSEFRLPLSPSLLVRGLDIESSSFFNSNTVPLKLSFLNSDPTGENIDIIFKVGDDLRQDILILQMIKLMEKIWIRAGLDLKMVTYDCVATGPDQGMLELVTDSATLRTIQTERGVTGSFKDKPLSDWLMRYNTSESDYRKAVDNFTCSCAGYCVATYVLGICDRHNDNIMVKRSGHMFHIDFGKILGNAQMFGSIKRDRVPFVLTRDMAYVINDGDRPTSRFQQFVDLCCTAYNELRRHTHTVLSLLSLMLPSGIAELSSADDVIYVRDALLPGRSDAEATYAFTKHIEDSLGSVATQINFFIHNLAQLKFSSPQAPPTLLSFVPQAYSIETDGRIISAVIVAYYMRYYPDAHMVYQIQVTRSQSNMTMLFRRYREFDELHSRLTLCFPSDNLPNFPGKTFLPGKSRARETVEKRLVDLNKYISQLLDLEASISESDVVYTFFHCLLRDEQDKIRMEEENANESGAISGRVKVHLMYDRRSQSLDVMIRHVRDLIPRDGSDTADPYVKMYLKPDVTKTTKQKTKIARRTLHPTYNETFTYKIPPQVLPQKSLELSVWDASVILNKQCLAIATVELCTLQNELTSGYGYWIELHSPTHNSQSED